MLGWGCKSRSTAMSDKSTPTIATMGIDIGKNSFHVVGLDQRGAIVLRQKWSRGQIEARLANMPPCLIGMEACVGGHHLSRKLQSLGHDARLMPARYIRPYAKGQKKPVSFDPAHPYVPNNIGKQPTFRIADLTNPNLKSWVVERM